MPVQFGFDLLTEIQGVQFRFASAAKNHNGWRVQSVSWSEAISGLYSVELTLSAEFPAPDASTMLGENASLEITRGDETRLVHGIVESVADGAWSSANTTAIVTLVPALALLQHRSHARIFSEQTVPEVVESVLNQALRPFGRKLEPPSLTRSDYPRREYIVQHGETDLAFVKRLLAEEGIWFHFEHPGDGDVERLCLRDLNEHAPSVARGAEMEVSLDREANAQHPAITAFGRTLRLRPTQCERSRSAGG